MGSLQQIFVVPTMQTSLGLCLLASAKALVNYSGDQVLRVHEPKFDLSKLAELEKFIGGTELDVWSGRVGQVDFRVKKENVDRVGQWFSENGLDFEVFIEDIGSRISQERTITSDKQGEFNFTRYHNFDEILQWSHETCDSNRDICRIQHIGYSYEGRPMDVLHFGAHDQGQTHHEHAMFLLAGIHAREWISPASTIAVVDRIIKNFRVGHKQENDLLRRADLYVLPVTNVDGYAYTWDVDRMWRKTRTPNANSNCSGTDPNRNWMTPQWGDDIGSSGDPCSQTYRGPHPFSEPCIQNVRDFVRDTHYQHPIKVFFDIHSYSQLWMYPPAETYDTVPNDGTLARVSMFATGAIYTRVGCQQNFQP